MHDTKSIFASKTFWINIISTGIGILGVFIDSEWVKENPKIVSGLFTAVGILNVFLRSITTKPVTLPGGDSEVE